MRSVSFCHGINQFSVVRDLLTPFFEEEFRLADLVRCKECVYETGRSASVLVCVVLKICQSRLVSSAKVTWFWTKLYPTRLLNIRFSQMIIVADQGCWCQMGALGVGSGCQERTDRLAVRYFLQEISRTESQKSLRERMLLVRLRDFQQRLQLWPAVFLGKRFEPNGNFMRSYLNPGWCLLLREVELSCWEVEGMLGGLVFAKAERFMSMLTKSKFCYLFFQWDVEGLMAMFRVRMVGLRGAQTVPLWMFVFWVSLNFGWWMFMEVMFNITTNSLNI